MCGIVGAVAKGHQNIVPVLLEGLKRLEYRGYDSAGLAVLTGHPGSIQRLRRTGKVVHLKQAVESAGVSSNMGIAHTRWATHGAPEERNAHPILVGNRIAVVHNGIIDNHPELKSELLRQGHVFDSDTDTETIALLIWDALSKVGSDMVMVLRSLSEKLRGAYAIAVMDAHSPGVLFLMRAGSPLVLGLGEGINYLASDPLALKDFTNRFIYLEEADIACMDHQGIKIYDKEQQLSDRVVKALDHHFGDPDLGDFPHYMLKEIYEQPEAIAFGLNHLNAHYPQLDQCFGPGAKSCFSGIQHIQLVACGTSYYAGLLAKYWLEDHANVPCSVEIASEFRYRNKSVLPNTLLVLISQSGETADVLSVLKEAKSSLAYSEILAICNVAESSLMRETTLHCLTHAGPEIGVCSTKAFSTQLLSLLALTMAFSTAKTQESLHATLPDLVGLLNAVLDLRPQIKHLAQIVAQHDHVLFLGRGEQYPIALEGALKLKELSYIHAEAYPAGELKHGPLALVDETMLIIVSAPPDRYFQKLRSNIEEIRARKGSLIILTSAVDKINGEWGPVLQMPECPAVLEPWLYAVAFQLLSYEVALLRGTDVDKPRNLAKSVTVE